MDSETGKGPADKRDGTRGAAAESPSERPHPSHARVRLRRGMILLFITILLAVVSYPAWMFFDRAEKVSSVERTLPALLTVLYLMDDQEHPVLAFATSNTWMRFTTEEYQTALEVSKEFGDAAIGQSAWSASASLVDPWGRPYGIAARIHDGYREFIVWSVGEDGLAETPDDVVRPYEATMP